MADYFPVDGEGVEADTGDCISLRAQKDKYKHQAYITVHKDNPFCMFGYSESYRKKRRSIYEMPRL